MFPYIHIYHFIYIIIISYIISSFNTWCIIPSSLTHFFFCNISYHHFIYHIIIYEVIMVVRWQHFTQNHYAWSSADNTLLKIIMVVRWQHFIWNYYGRPLTTLYHNHYGRPLTTLYSKSLWSSADNILLKIIMVVRWQHFTKKSS